MNLLTMNTKSPLTAAERNQRMLERYLDGETLQEIGEDYGVTRERVRQIVTRLAGPLAEESRAKRAADRLAAHQTRLRDFLAEYGGTARRMAGNGNTRDETIRRLQLLNPGFDAALADEALRESNIVFDRGVDDIFSPAAIEAGVWYLLGSDLGLSPDPGYAAEILDLDLMEELAEILHGGDAGAEDIATVLGVIGAARKHATENPEVTITGARYDSLRRELVEALGWTFAKGSSPWPPTRQTIMHRYTYWNAALEALGLAKTSRGRTPGLVKYTTGQYHQAVRDFLEFCAATGTAATYLAYEERARELAGTAAEIPSGSSIRNFFGPWSEALRRASEAAA